LRRRRRQSTQIIKKKNFSSNTSLPYISGAKTGFNWKRFFTWIFVIVIMGSITYYAYQWNPQPAGRDILDDKTEPVSTPEPEAIEPVVEAPFEKNIQVEILNGCGVNGVAKIFQDYLRDQGFDVVNTDNYTENDVVRWDIEHSMIIDHVGQFEQARAIARTLGISEEKILTREKPDAIYDVSIVIGKDYTGLKGIE